MQKLNSVDIARAINVALTNQPKPSAPFRRELIDGVIVTFQTRAERIRFFEERERVSVG